MRAVFRDGRKGRRGTNGRFLPGTAPGPGRSKGCENQATADAKRIKAAILGTWDELGPDAIRRLAEEQPATYLGVMVKLLPNEHADGAAAAAAEPAPVRLTDEQLQRREAILRRLGYEPVSARPAE